MGMAALLAMWPSPVVSFLFHYSQKFSYDISFQLSEQVLRKKQDLRLKKEWLLAKDKLWPGPSISKK